MGETYPKRDDTTPGMRENIPPAQNPLTTAKATSGGIEVATVPSEHSDLVSIFRNTTQTKRAHMAKSPTLKEKQLQGRE
jgi:hypothetical protein